MKVRHIVARRQLRTAPLQHLQVLSLRTGDVLVLQVAGRVSLEQAARMRTYVLQHVPGHDCLVLDDSAQIGAVRPGQHSAAP